MLWTDSGPLVLTEVMTDTPKTSSPVSGFRGDILNALGP